MSLARIVVAGTHSGVGKTTVATGIMAALVRRGLHVQAFKVGPDFIDPTFHCVATGRASHNLDGWMLPRETNLGIFARAAGDADVAVIEGVMGMFDGKDGLSLAGTTAEMAIWLDAPVVLVLDASALAGSAAAIVHGFETLVPEVRVAAVVANKVAGPGHYEFLRQAIGARCRAELVGWIAREAALEFPERHLGLHLAEETLTGDRLRALAERIEAHVDLDRLLALSRAAEVAAAPASIIYPRVRARIGIARDAAFCFYYQANLDLLRERGAELVAFSPMADTTLPDGLSGIYFGGGYPELHAPALAANQTMRRSVADFVNSGGPVYAECGGFMYLTAAIVDVEDREWPMVGAFPTRARMQNRMARLGYVEVETSSGAARGHEYRHSVIDVMPPDVERPYAEAYRIAGAVGSYAHLHFLSCPRLAEDFIDRCERWQSK